MIAIRPPILLYVARAARLWQAALAGKRNIPIKARVSTFYRKAQGTAGTIVDLQNLLHVAVGGVARVLPCIFGDGFGVHRGEPCNQTLPAVLIPVHCHKAGNAVEDTGQERIGIAPPCLHDNLQGFLINVRAIVLVNIIGRADAVDLPLGSDAIQCKSRMQPRRNKSAYGGNRF